MNGASPSGFVRGEQPADLLHGAAPIAPARTDGKDGIGGRIRLDVGFAVIAKGDQSVCADIIGLRKIFVITQNIVAGCISRVAGGGAHVHREQLAVKAQVFDCPSQAHALRAALGVCSGRSVGLRQCAAA